MNNPDNMIEVVVHNWKSGRKYICHSCNKGKFTAEEPTCPECNQKHQVIVRMP